MKTYTTKTAANGATLYYSTETGKRIAKAVALENERNYLLANAEEITAEVDDEEIVDEIDDEEEVSEELDTEDSVEEIDEDAEDDDENEVNENDVTEELNEDRRALETINPEEIVAIATVKMNIAEDEMKLAEAEVDKAYAAAGRISAKTSDEKRKAAYARIDAADAAYKTACEVYKARCEELKAAYVAASEARTAKIAETEENVEVEETTTEQVAEVKADETPAAGISPDEKLAELVNAAKTAWEAQRDKSFNSTQAETFRAATKAITKFLDTTRSAFKVALPENIIVADNWREGEFSGSSDLPSFVIRDLKTGKTLGTYKTLAEVEAAVVEQVAQVESAQEYKPQTEPAPELTGKMKWAAELLDNYTYEFECDKETGKKGLARHYKRFNRYGEQVGKLVEVFTDKTSFILDHVNIVVKSIRTYYYINGETLSYFKGKFSSIWSDKYKAGMSMVGGEHLQVEVPDGQWKKYKNFMVNNSEFFQIMSERGACTIGEDRLKGVRG